MTATVRVPGRSIVLGEGRPEIIVPLAGADITRVLADNHVNLINATVGTSRDRVVTGRFVVELADPSHLDHTLASLRRIDGVFEAHRTTSTSRRPRR